MPRQPAITVRAGAVHGQISRIRKHFTAVVPDQGIRRARMLIGMGAWIAPSNAIQRSSPLLVSAEISLSLWSDCFRRVSPVVAHFGDRLLSEPTAGNQFGLGELLAM